jgi:hypothetical protein
MKCTLYGGAMTQSLSISFRTDKWHCTITAGATPRGSEFRAFLLSSSVPTNVPGHHRHFQQRRFDCIQRQGWQGQEPELITAMKDTFSTAELMSLRNDLLQGVLIDSREAAERLQVFLMDGVTGLRPRQP